MKNQPSKTLKFSEKLEASQNIASKSKDVSKNEKELENQWIKPSSFFVSSSLLIQKIRCQMLGHTK